MFFAGPQWSWRAVIVSFLLIAIYLGSTIDHFHTFSGEGSIDHSRISEPREKMDFKATSDPFFFISALAINVCNILQQA